MGQVALTPSTGYPQTAPEVPVVRPPFVPRDLVGYVDSPAWPSDRRERLGSVHLEPTGPFRVREDVDVTLTVTVGHHGMDDRGTLKLVWRFPADGGAWQFDDPHAPNHVAVSASRPCQFRCTYAAFADARPWFKAATFQVVGGCLAEGDTITLRLRIRLQTFCEDAFEWRVLVDPCATGHFVEVGAVGFPILPGPPAVLRLVGPTAVRPEEPFSLGLRADDTWGNPSDLADLQLTLRSDLPIQGLPAAVRLAPGERSARLEGLAVPEAGVVQIAAFDADGVEVARAAPLVVGGARTWWADLHGQSGETVGVNTAERYFGFARDLAFLDAAGHQANDFQLNASFWAHLQHLTAAFHEPGRFITLPGYEWSGNTAVGGDRNVYFRHEGRPIRRSSHALLTDRTDIDSDCTTATELFEALRGEDAVAFAHVGGRWADLERAHDGRTERAVEVHSAWGTFPWLLHDALRLGHRVGVVANSDGHKGRPGASHPGAATFGAFGGLTCLVAPELTRDSVFRCLRQRRCYATTGARLHLEVVVQLPDSCVRHDDDPALGPCGTRPTRRATLGDIVTAPTGPLPLHVHVVAASPVVEVEVFRGVERVERHHPWRGQPLGQRVRVTWSGAEYRGRGRETSWDGTASLTGASWTAIRPFQRWNLDRPFGLRDEHTAAWSSITTGNLAGFDGFYEGHADPHLRVRTPHARVDVALADLAVAPVEVHAGGLERRLEVRRLPAELGSHDVHLQMDFAHGPGESALWVRVTTEDGHQAFSSPIYLLEAS